MKKKRKIVAVFTAMAMMLSLTACGSGNEGNTGDSIDTAPVATGDSVEDTAVTSQAEDSDEAVTLTVWCWDPNYNINALRVAEEIYQREHPNFSLDILERNSQEIMEKLATTTTSGTMEELPDIMLFDDSIVKQQLMSYPEAFADLTDLGFKTNFLPARLPILWWMVEIMVFLLTVVRHWHFIAPIFLRRQVTRLTISQTSPGTNS